jgi:hypothetical protein
MHFIGRTNLSKRVEKRLETCHASFERQCQSLFLEVAQNGIDKATSIKIVAARYSSSEIIGGMQGMIWR